MPYVIRPKGAQMFTEESHEWREQNELWREQRGLYYDDPQNKTYPEYVSFNDWLIRQYAPLVYATRQAAFESGLFSPQEHEIVFLLSDEEDCAWRAREERRFQRGEYRPTPWKESDAYPDHFAHLSLDDATKIAYTKDAEHGVADRQTVVRIGRYLEMFYKDRLSAEQIADYISSCGAEHYQLKIVTSAADIREVYQGGPSSCMGGKGGGQQFADWDTHPVEVYGDSDLACAYYGKQSHVSARAIVWPANKTYSTIYGDIATLRKMLEDAGYTYGGVHGAKIRAIPYNGKRHTSTYYMPYIDGMSTASLSRDRKWFHLDDDGDYTCGDTSGYVDPHARHTCDNCGDTYNPEQEGTSEYCDSCCNDQYSCERCGHTSFDEDDFTSLSHGSYCNDCAESYMTTCRDCGDTWFEENLPRTMRTDRRDRGVTDWCRDCSDNMHLCADCDGLAEIPKRRCSDCNPPKPVYRIIVSTLRLHRVGVAHISLSSEGL